MRNPAAWDKIPQTGKAFGCNELRDLSGSSSVRTWYDICWWILPPGSDYITLLNFTHLEMDPDCVRFHVAVTTEKNETRRFCNGGVDGIKSIGKIKMEIVYRKAPNTDPSHSFVDFKYEIVRSIFADQDVNDTREYLISELHDQGYTDERWGEDTPRVMTALHLVGATDYADEKERITQLDLHVSSALLMNSTHPLSVNELSMIVNALTATCQDPRQFYGQNLLQILDERAASSMIPNPNAILSICVAGGKLENNIVDKMFYRLMQNSTHDFSNDHKAMSLMALTCIKKRVRNFGNNPYATEFYNEAIESLVQEQCPDGSFGSAYTTALVTQALIGTGKFTILDWSFSPSFRFLLKHANSSDADLQLRSLILPVLSGKCLADLGEIDCSNSSRPNKDELRSGTMVPVFYSLLIGEQRKLIKIINVLVPANSSAYSVMQTAQLADPAFQFESVRMADTLHIYRINGIANDFQAGKIWKLYTVRTFPNEILIPQNISADKLSMRRWERLVMWYKTVHAQLQIVWNWKKYPIQYPIFSTFIGLKKIAGVFLLKMMPM